MEDETKSQEKFLVGGGAGGVEWALHILFPKSDSQRANLYKYH